MTRLRQLKLNTDGQRKALAAIRVSVIARKEFENLILARRPELGGNWMASSGQFYFSSEQD
jgi:hypothetical protein